MTAWTFVDALHATDGFYIEGVGTDTNVTGREVIAVLEGVTLPVCQQLLRGLGLAYATPPEPPTAVNWATPAPTYNTAVANTLWGNADIEKLPFNCIDNDGPYHYIHTLVEQ